MKTIVITPKLDVDDEIETCNLLLCSSIERLHVRKPSYSKHELEVFLLQLDHRFYSKISLHAHHDLVEKLSLGGKHFVSNKDVKATNYICSKSFHSMNEMITEKASLRYGFLSPVFDSISKIGYTGQFNHDKLRKQLNQIDQFPVFALGGIELSRMKQVIELGFDGVALLGTVWQMPNTKQRMNRVNEILNA